MNIENLLDDYLKDGIALRVENGELAYRAYGKALSEEAKKDIKKYKEQIVSYLNQSRVVEKNEMVGMPDFEVAQRPERLPLSFAQQRLWYADKAADGVAFNMIYAFRFSGSLDAGVLKQALRAIIDRHEILRTVYVEINLELCQVVMKDYKLPLVQFDLSALSEDKQSARIERLRIVEGKKRFNLSEDVMVRMQILKLSEESHVILFTMHHIVGDRRSFEIFISEFNELSSAFSRKLQNPLKQLQYQYADFALWERQSLQGEALERQLNYWRQQLKGASFLELSDKKPERGSHREGKAARYTFEIPKDTSVAIEKLSSELGASLYMTSLAAFEILLSRFSGQRDVVLSTVVEGREREELFGLIGFFVNVLLIRVKIDESVSFKKFLMLVKKTVLDAFDHQYVPFDKVVAELNKEFGRSAAALGRVSFTLGKYTDLPSEGEEDSRFSNAVIVDDQRKEFDTKTDLTLTIEEYDKGKLRGVFEYAVDIFDSETVEELGSKFVALLGHVSASPEVPLEEVDLSSPMSLTDDSSLMPLSGMQFDMWLDMEVHPTHKHFFNLFDWLVFHGPINPEMLEQAVQVVVDNTCAFRTKFLINSNGILEHKVLSKNTIRVPLIDFSLEKESDQKADLWIEQQKERCIDITTEEPFSFNLIKLSDEKYIWVFHRSHLITDFVGTEIFKQSVENAYSTLMRSENPSMLSDQDQYIRYLHADKQYKFTSQFVSDRKFWLSQKPSEDPVSLSVKSRAGSSRERIILSSFTLENDVGSAIKLAAQTRHFMSVDRLLIAMVVLYLHKMTGREELSVGLPVHGRFDSGTFDLITCAATTLPVQFSMKSGFKLGEALGKAGGDIGVALNHGRFRYREIRELWGLTAEDSEPYKVGINVITSMHKQEFSEIPFDLHSSQVNHHDIEIIIYQSAITNEIYVSLEGNSRFYNLWELDEHSERLKSFIRKVVDCPLNTIISDLPVMSPEEERKLIAEFNVSETRGFNESLLHKLFESQVDVSPGSVAVKFESREYSYNDLNIMANQLAHYMLTKDVGRGALVALFVSRSVEMIVGMLAALKAGAAYLPLDTKQPSERLKLILDDAQPTVIITMESLICNLPSTKAKAITLDSQSEGIKEYETENPDSQFLGLGGHDLAYVIYTSGSTGRPKGVMVEHRSVVNHCLFASDEFELANSDKILQFASYSFDASIEEIFPTLCSGAALVLRDKALPSGIELVNFVIENGITVLNLPTAYWQANIDELSSPKLLNSKLRLVVVGGEKVGIEPYRNWHSRVGGQIAWLNTYGPTEATITSTFFWSDKCVNDLQDVPIGRPIPNAKIYILNSLLEPVPIGMVGEICIGGIGVARGYLNQNDLSRDRFIENPFDHFDLGRIYRSGDLGRWLPDGNIEFIGRADDQVKIRGFRLELGEVETALLKHDSLYNAVASVHSSEILGNQLVAHIVPAPQYLDEIAAEANKENLKDWALVFDEHYTNPAFAEEGDLNFVGWNNSYSGNAIPLQEMQEWLTNTSQLISSLKPKRLLEVGCGTGLLLFQYAKLCDTVHAMDISAHALTGIQKELDSRNWKHVHLTKGDALSFDRFGDITFDTVVVNSVVQYFPNRLYLEEMIAGLVCCVENEGKILIGDVRNLDLISAHCAAVVRGQLLEDTQLSVFEKRVQRLIQQEKELLISPSFFAQLPERYPEIGRVDIMMKRGLGDNEMQRYRYEVVLYKSDNRSGDGSLDSSPNTICMEWYDYNSFDGVKSLVGNSSSDFFGVSGIKNPRVKQDVMLADGLGQEQESRIVELDEKPGSLGSEFKREAELFESLLEYAEQCGYRCGITWSQANLDCIDLIFSRVEFGKKGSPPILAREPYSISYQCNYPQMAKLGRDLSGSLQEHLATSLPEYMIPKIYMALDRLPLTAHGKINKNALPVPDESDLVKAEYAAPNNEFEEKLCLLWQDVLGLQQIGVHDNFFKLGGHSLLATKLVSLYRQEFGKEVPLRVLFESPTVAEQSNLFQIHSEASLVPAIYQVDRTQKLALSFAQQRLWFLSQLESGSAQYHINGALRLNGELNKAAFIEAIIAIINRHEVLRTRFIADDEAVYQEIAGEFQTPVQDFDISSLGEDEKLKIMHRHIEDEASLPFDLENDTMLRVRLLTIAPKEFVMLFSMHHIASDGLSVGILTHEFETLYNGFCCGKGNLLNPLEFQYADFSNWQRNWLQGDVLKLQMNYWERQLRNIPEIHSLPLEYRRPKIQVFKGASFDCLIDRDLLEKIYSLCANHNVTMFMFLETVFSVLLGRYSNETDIVIGSPIAGRMLKETEAMIGLFLNMLVLRCNLSDDPEFEALLKSNKETILDGYANQHVPFEMLVETLKPERSTSYNPIFQILFSLQNSETRKESLLGLDVAPIEQDGNAIRYDLELVSTELPSGMCFTWNYNTALFTFESVERMSKSFEMMLNVVVEAPKTKLSQIDLMTDLDKHIVFKEWNNTECGYPEHILIHELVEEQASIVPNDIAIVCNGKSVSYLELNEESNRLAHYLIMQGVGVGSLVGVLVDRSIEMVVAILAVIKAGGAYVPLDPDYPNNRLQYILDDCAAKLVVSQSSLISKVSVINRATICLDEDNVRMELASQSSANVMRNDRALTSGDLVYVIYTSGSTGRPKGVCICHGALSNLLHSMAKEPGLSKQDRLLAVTSLGFDIAGLELWLPLVSGAVMHIATSELTVDGRQLGNYINENSISVMQATPATWSLLVENSDWYPKVEGFKALCGGEALPINLAVELGKRCSELWNMYGPTETTIWSCCQKVEEEKINIGRGIDNTQLYVANDHLGLQPIGAVGQLCIGGAGLALGYHKRPDLTTEKFISNPFSREYSERLYLTGDLVRWLADGNLEFIGRIDSQIKIRGFRIEPGEIESQILSHVLVQNCAVVAHEIVEGDRCLVAYVVVKDLVGSVDIASVLRQYLQEELPEYMVPTAYVSLEKLPLTPNGKIDRNALPAPDSEAFGKEEHKAPDTPTEVMLVGIWAKLFQLSPEIISTTANFFSLGGHSLLATRLVNLVMQEKGVLLPLRVIFEAQTIQSISRSIDISVMERELGDSSCENNVVEELTI